MMLAVLLIFSVGVTGFAANEEKISGSNWMSYPFTKGVLYGVVSVDFADKELCRKIYETNVFSNDPAEATQAPQENTVFAFLGEFVEKMRSIVFSLVASFVK